MKMCLKLITIVGLICSAILSNAQNTNKHFGINVVNFKGFAYIPQGTYQIAKDSTGAVETINCNAFYLSETEVTNGMYSDFLIDLKKQGKISEYKVALPDSTAWNKLNIVGAGDYTKSYSQMKDLPVVNISKEAAQLYCKWLSEKLTKEHKDNLKIEVRLPSSNEWMCAATGQMANAKYAVSDANVLVNGKGEYTAQIKALSLPIGPVKTKTFKPNDFGLYDMTGNVAEMVSDKPITKGGSWNSEPKNTTIISQEPIEKSPMVGFRVLLTFVK